MVIKESIDSLDTDAREQFNERAAIYEYLGGYSRATAEKMAWVEVRRYLERRGLSGKDGAC